MNVFVLAVASLVLLGAGVAVAQAPIPTGRSAGPVTKARYRPQGFNSDIPPLLGAAHTVFISNAGSDPGLYPHPFTGTQDRAYGYFAERLQAEGHFQVVDTPGEADLVLEVSMQAPLGSVGGDKVKGTTDPLPTFKLVAYDRPTHYVLWTVSQTVDQAVHQKTHDKNFDAAIDSVLAQFLAAAEGKAMPGTGAAATSASGAP